MLPLLSDENFSNTILRRLLRRKPEADIVRVQDVDLAGADDTAILEWAARNGRVLLTHDLRTMPRFAFDRVRAEQPMPGVFAVGRFVPIERVVEELLILAECSLEGKWEGQVRFLPLR